MALEQTLTVLNTMQADGVIGQYAIGGAVAAFLYIEPGATFDLDVFIAWEASAGGLLDIDPIYSYLLARGCHPQGEAIVVGDWAVQFLPAGNALISEALQEARAITISGAATRIFTLEHLMAICLQTGRPKDTARLVQFVEEGTPDQGKLDRILENHGLTAQWTIFQAKFPSPA